MYDVEDIMGCNVDKCKHVPSEGIAAFMKRAVDRADAAYRKVGSDTCVVCVSVCFLAGRGPCQRHGSLRTQ